MDRKRQKDVCLLIRAALWNECCDETDFADVDWAGVWEEMCLQAVEALPGTITSAVPGVFRPEWEAACAERVAASLRLYATQAEIVGILQENGITAVTLKGAAAGFYYPYPEYRATGDMDLLVSPEDFDKAAELIRGNGWETTEEDSARHITFQKEGILLELHHFFCSETRIGRADTPSRQIIASIQKAKHKEIMGMPFFCLPELENGLVLLEHIYHHISTGLGLRQIIDWMMYVNAVLDDEFWQKGFAQAARTYGVEKLAQVTARMAQLYLGLRIEDRTWCMEADEKVCDRFMDYIFNSGNFGGKQEKTRKNEIAILNHLRRSPFERLQTAGLHNWKAAQKFVFLRPFAWLYQSFRYVRQGIVRKNGLISVLKDSKQSREQAELFALLGLEGYERYE